MIDANVELPLFFDFALRENLSQGKKSLYLALLSECCEAKIDVFEVSLSRIYELTRMKKNTVLPYRKKLMECGLIDYFGGNKYAIKSLFGGENVVYSTPTETVYSTPAQKVYSTPHASSFQSAPTKDLEHNKKVYSTPTETVYSTPEEMVHSTPKKDEDRKTATAVFPKDAMSLWGIG